MDNVVQDDWNHKGIDKVTSFIKATQLLEIEYVSPQVVSVDMQPLQKPSKPWHGCLTLLAFCL
jgi:hypothetical protein